MPAYEFERARSVRQIVSTAVVYLAVSLALHHEVLNNFSNATTGWATSESNFFVWWLNWSPWSLLHFQDQLFTTYQNHPGGVNGMWSATVPVLGILLAPVTLTFGPVASYNIGMILGPVVSGLSLALALGPYVKRWVPRRLAGLLYGFCPFIIAHTSVGHLNLVWAVLPPALLWAVHSIFIQPGTQPWRAGALLGSAFAVQTGIYTQTVALGAIVLLVVAAVLAVRWPRRVAQRVPFIAKAAAACLGSYVVLCAYPLILLLVGPGRPRVRIRNPAQTGADAANLLVPNHLSMFQLGTNGLGDKLHSYAGEQGGYIGVGLLVLLILAVRTVHFGAIKLTAAVGLVLVVLSLGVHLVILGSDTGVALPWQLLENVPLLADAEAVRLQIFIAACVAVIVAFWLEHVLTHTWNGGRRAVVVAATLVAVATWLPSNGQQAVQTYTPKFFTTASDHLPPGAVVETFPRVSGRWEGGADPLLWQVASGMAYRTTGGYFIGSDTTHDLLLEGPVNAYQVGASQSAADAPPTSADLAAAAMRDLRAHGVTVVVVVDQPGLKAGKVAAWTSHITGSRGERIGDVWLFRLANP